MFFRLYVYEPGSSPQAIGPVNEKQDHRQITVHVPSDSYGSVPLCPLSKDANMSVEDVTDPLARNIYNNAN